MKFNIKKIRRAVVVGVASLALIVPLSMNSGTVANAAEGPYYDGDLGDLAYNGFTNEDGYWIGSKRDKWLFDHGLLEPDGDYSDIYDVVNDYAHTRHISFMRAFKIYNATEKMPDKDFRGKDVESDADAMDIYEEMHHKHLNRLNHHASKRHAITRRGKRTSRKSRKKNVKRGHKARRPRTRKGKRVAKKGIKRNRKRIVKPRKPKKRRRTAKRQPKPKKPTTKQGKRKWITYHLPSKQKGSKQGKQQPRE